MTMTLAVTSNITSALVAPAFWSFVPENVSTHVLPVVETEPRITAAYARAYWLTPLDAWVGRAGLRLGGQLLKDEPPL